MLFVTQIPVFARYTMMNSTLMNHPNLLSNICGEVSLEKHP